MVLSVNEVPNGSADSMIEDISQELQKLRDTAHALRLPNADKINWTLIYSILLFGLCLDPKTVRELKMKRNLVMFVLQFLSW